MAVYNEVGKEKATLTSWQAIVQAVAIPLENGLAA